MNLRDFSAILKEFFPEKFNLGDNSFLYHYTTIDVFDELVRESGELYCTHYMDLNDNIEFWKGYKYFCDYLERKCEEASGVKADDLRNVLKQLRLTWQKLHKLYVDASWVMSFSTERDSLSQWRFYTDRANGGVAVGFGKKELEDALQEHRSKTGSGWNAMLLPCIYYGSGVDERLDRFIAYLLEQIDTRMSLWQEELEMSIFVFSSIIKDISFEMEHEWRLVIQSTDKVALKEVRVIGGKARLPVGIGVKDKRRVGSLMKEVLISPHGNKNRLWHSALLPKYACDGLTYKTHSSDLPYNGK